MKTPIAAMCFVLGTLLAEVAKAVSIAHATEGITSFKSNIKVKKDD